MIPRSRLGMAWRFALAGVLLVVASAATTAVAGLLQVKDVVHYLDANPGIVTPQVVLPAAGAPQTILLIGSDHRAHEPFRLSNTDTMLLVRLNAKSSTINVMSIPRDLQVDIPGHGIDKINAAYSDGGYGLLIKTIKQNVFPNLRVNHIVDTNFTGFSDLVDAIGCVYSDVDRRYYNDTNSGLPGDNYSSIDIQPGYQKLCGHNQSVSGALPFVRFRHLDSDIVREARQQDFIRWAKDQFSVSTLLSERDKLLRIFGKHSTLDKDLQSNDGVLKLFDLILNSDTSTIHQVPFPADLQPCTQTSCIVTSNQQAEQAAFARFMAATPKASSAAANKAKATPASLKGHKKISKIPTGGLVDASTDGHAQATALTHPGMPVYYPKLIKAGSVYCSSLAGNCVGGGEPAAQYAHAYPRQYVIRDQQGHPHAAYRMTIVLNSLLGQYYGVQGTTWSNPPLLRSPSGTRQIGGKKLFLYANGGRLTTVAWHNGPDVYWISNTLASTIPNPQMVGIAASLTRAGG
ncbi:MAG TPA: LCP family protein [Solirubrobacteraceae bacterium]|nr:LCP family protein [Solirubrobacteraceae bacterium]